MRFACSHYLGHKISTENDVRVKAEHPISACRPDRLVLSGGKSNVSVVVDHTPSRFDHAQQFARAIGGGVVHDDHLELTIVLLLNRGDALTEILCRVPGNDCDGDHW